MTTSVPPKGAAKNSFRGTSFEWVQENKIYRNTNFEGFHAFKSSSTRIELFAWYILVVIFAFLTVDGVQKVISQYAEQRTTVSMMLVSNDTVQVPPTTVCLAFDMQSAGYLPPAIFQRVYWSLGYTDFPSNYTWWTKLERKLLEFDSKERFLNGRWPPEMAALIMRYFAFMYTSETTDIGKTGTAFETRRINFLDDYIVDNVKLEQFDYDRYKAITRTYASMNSFTMTTTYAEHDAVVRLIEHTESLGINSLELHRKFTLWMAEFLIDRGGDGYPRGLHISHQDGSYAELPMSSVVKRVQMHVESSVIEKIAFRIIMAVPERICFELDLSEHYFKHMTDSLSIWIDAMQLYQSFSRDVFAWTNFSVQEFAQWWQLELQFNSDSQVNNWSNLLPQLRISAGSWIAATAHTLAVYNGITSCSTSRTRGKCLAECRASLIRTQCSCTALIAITDSNIDVKDPCSANIYHKCLNYTNTDDASCMAECLPHCSQRNYMVQRVSENAGFTTPYRTFRLTLVFAAVSYPVFEEQAEMTFSNFIGDLGGVFDFYLGISIIGILHFLTYTAKRIYFRIWKRPPAAGQQQPQASKRSRGSQPSQGSKRSRGSQASQGPIGSQQHQGSIHSHAGSQASAVSHASKGPRGGSSQGMKTSDDSNGSQSSLDSQNSAAVPSSTQQQLLKRTPNTVQPPKKSSAAHTRPDKTSDFRRMSL